MKKILFSLIMIAVTVGIVTASAYALFTDSSDVKGVSITSGDANLLVNGGESLNANWFADKVYPGWVSGQRFNLKNASASNINLNLTAKLSSVAYSWDSLKDTTLVALVEYSSWQDADAALAAKNPSLNAVENTGWISLADWYTTAKSIDTSIQQNQTHDFVFWTMIDKEATSQQIAGKSVSTNWLITANQI